MAIVKMKKLKVIALSEEREKLFSKLLREGCVEVTDQSAKLSSPEWSKLLRLFSFPESSNTESAAAAVKTSLEALKKYGNIKDGLFIKRLPVSKEEFESEEKAEKAREVTGEISELLGKIAALNTEKNRLENRRAGLLPWLGLDLPLECQGTEHVAYKAGVVPAATDIAALKAELASTDIAADIFEISVDRQQSYLFLAALRDDEEEAVKFLGKSLFSAVSFQGETGKPSEIVSAIDARLSEAEEEILSLGNEIASYKKDRDALRLYSDRLSAKASREAGLKKLLTDGVICYFESWCPAENLGRVESILDECGCAYEVSDPTADEVQNVPVKLKNNKLTDAMNMVTEMYSLPSYACVDPNPLMFFFFILFYGIMLADMGYGLLMIIASALITKKYAPKGGSGHLFKLMGLCGVSTFLMGAATGGFFGDFIPQLAKMINPNTSLTALPALLSPLDDTMVILVGCMALGLIHMVFGMCVSVYLKFKRHQYMSIIWNEVTWWLIFAAIAVMVLGGSKVPLYIGIAMVLVGAGWEEKSIIKKIMAVFGSLYNNVTGYLGDILSYSRLMALMLAGSVIAQVFNTLGTIPGNVFAFLLISMVGNALNFALNLLGCYVHDLRLQCLEFFNKFYEDGGRPFRPMEINTKYVDIQHS